MPSNAEVIQMHLEEMLRETGQRGKVTWSAVMGYCIGYYGTITLDHVTAIMELERTGSIAK